MFSPIIIPVEGNHQQPLDVQLHFEGSLWQAAGLWPQILFENHLRYPARNSEPILGVGDLANDGALLP